jgi:flagella basal body P-ring formation protein FlgA
MARCLLNSIYMNNTRRNNWILTLPMLVLPLLARAQAQNVQPLTDVSSVATAFATQLLGSGKGTGSTIHVAAAALDSRLRLPLCSQALEGFAPSSARSDARLIVGVRCSQPMWNVYVPVSIETELRVLVLRDAAVRNSVITAENVESRMLRVAGRADSYITDAAQLRGRHLRVAAARGTPLTIELLAADLLVKRGQHVTLIAAVGGLEVRAQGEAVGDATPAGRVRVLNLMSHKIVEGQVESSDRVRVSL